MSRLGLFMSGAALLCVLAAFDAAGYRYGVSDQAFYVPAIFLSVDPNLYPHDSSLIRAQGDLIVFDEVYGDFQQLTPAHARALAVKYELDYLISERPIDLPVAYRNGRFSVYTLGKPVSAVSGEHPIIEH